MTTSKTPQMNGAVWAIVLAAGSGSRFGRRKQFERIGGRRLVDCVVNNATGSCDHVALVLPPGHVWNGPGVDRLAAGGRHRSTSVRAGLALLPADTEIVVIADAAHPLASQSLYRALIDKVRCGADGAVPGLPPLEIIQRVRHARVTETVPKDDLVMTQTPQAFRFDLLQTAHRDLPETVDDSSLLVELGHQIQVIPGEPWNLHVSTPAELTVLDGLADTIALPGRRAAGRDLPITSGMSKPIE